MCSLQSHQHISCIAWQQTECAVGKKFSLHKDVSRWLREFVKKCKFFVKLFNFILLTKSSPLVEGVGVKGMLPKACMSRISGVKLRKTAFSSLAVYLNRVRLRTTVPLSVSPDLCSRVEITRQLLVKWRDKYAKVAKYAQENTFWSLCDALMHNAF